MSEDSIKAPDWFPQCPWPEDMWLDTIESIGPKYKAALPDDNLRTCVSGVLMRHGWRLAEREILERLRERGIEL